MNRVAAFVTVNRRNLNTDGGSIGEVDERSTTTNAMSRTVPPARQPTTSGLDQPAEPPWISAYVMAASPPTAVTAPFQSMCGAGFGSRDSGTCRAVTQRTTAPSGTLITKIQRHEAAAIRYPPRRGPAAVATPPRP